MRRADAVDAEAEVGHAMAAEVREICLLVGIAYPGGLEIATAEEPAVAEHGDHRRTARGDPRGEVQPALAVPGDLAADEGELADANVA